MLEEFAYEGQRPLERRHVQFLAYEMTGGRFKKKDLMRIAYHEGKGYLTDGQHRLRAIVASGVTVTQIILHIECADLEEVGDDYMHTDIGKIRTVNDMYKPARIGEKLGLKHASEVNAVGHAVGVILRGFELQGLGINGPHERSRAVYKRLLEEWGEWGCEYLEIIRGADKLLFQPLRNQAVMAVAMVTLRHCHDKAREFWEAAAGNDGLRKGQPARALVNFIAAARVSATAKTRRDHPKSIAVAWNKHYEDDELVLIRLSDLARRRPIVIRGTPYDGKTVIRPAAESGA